MLGAPLTWDDFGDGAALSVDEAAGFTGESEEEETGLSDDVDWGGPAEEDTEATDEPDEESLALIDEPVDADASEDGSTEE
jgi:hypothetical protein